MKWCSSQNSALSVLRGSIKTTFPPRSWMPTNFLCGFAPVDIIAPLETFGFEPNNKK